ncbi:MAG: hypothetical protein AVDCRST_MAG18-559 [uncultured Thermomicrobiales bacterium]|uniref:ZIP Zinc transporter n=1 Tax=uncultured Thermomicrobiales bacterium TaxID=1645740 RepID=A0A6J4UR75_9BACT|nr:MAG: hypothetical protein AVDCRST_MAG18-559 [uncultured Thermomicrobiales bacterium]
MEGDAGAGMTIRLVSLLAAVALVLVHLFVGRLRFLGCTPRSHWLSLAGGVSVAYVFVHLLPELAEGQEALREVTGDLATFAGRHVYLIALGGLAAFYGLERAATAANDRAGRADPGDTASPGVFWLHMASFALYNGLIGYLLLHREERGLRPLLLFVVAMALHFAVTDHGLRAHHRATYDRRGRWILVAAIVAGWTLGLAVALPDAAIAALLAFLGGGVILNVLKEELPEERQSRFSSFALGAAAYAALLLAL